MTQSKGCLGEPLAPALLRCPPPAPSAERRSSSRRCSRGGGEVMPLDVATFPMYSGGNSVRQKHRSARGVGVSAIRRESGCEQGVQHSAII